MELQFSYLYIITYCGMNRLYFSHFSFLYTECVLKFENFHYYKKLQNICDVHVSLKGCALHEE